MLQGTVRWFNMDKGYGFIGQDQGGDDAFVHFSSIVDLPRSLNEGDKVTFELQDGPRGLNAVNVRRA